MRTVNVGDLEKGGHFHPAARLARWPARPEPVEGFGGRRPDRGEPGAWVGDRSQRLTPANVEGVA